MAVVEHGLLLGQKALWRESPPGALLGGSLLGQAAFRCVRRSLEKLGEGNTAGADIYPYLCGARSLFVCSRIKCAAGCLSCFLLVLAN